MRRGSPKKGSPTDPIMISSAVSEGVRLPVDPDAQTRFSAIIESCLMAAIIKNPDAFLGTVDSATHDIQKVWSNLYEKFLGLMPESITTDDQGIINFVYKVIYDAAMPRQFEVIGDEKKFDHQKLLVTNLDPTEFAELQKKAITFDAFIRNQPPGELIKKVLAMKCIGGALTDFPDSITLIDESILPAKRKTTLLSMRSALKPDDFFEHTEYRGRRQLAADTQTSQCIGTMKDHEVATLPPAIQTALHLERPYDKLAFEVTAHANGFNLAQGFGKYPSLSGASGSVGVMLIALYAASEKYFENSEAFNQYALVSSAFLVGGAYHSLFESLGMFYYARADRNVSLGISRDEAVDAKKAHKEAVFEHFLKHYDDFMPYQCEAGALIIDPTKFPKDFQPHLASIHEQLALIHPATKTVDSADVYLGLRFIQEFNRCADYQFTQRRTRHADENLMHDIVVIGAKLVAQGCLDEKEFVNKLESKADFYLTDKSNRTEGYDYEMEVLLFRESKKNALKTFLALRDDPVALQTAFEIVSSRETVESDLSTETGRLTQKVYVQLKEAEKNPSHKRELKLTEAFDAYSHRLITHKMIYHNPVSVFCALHHHLENKGLLNADINSADVHAINELAKLGRDELVSKGIHLPINDIIKFKIQYDDVSGAEKTTETLLSASKNLVYTLLLGASKNKENHTQESLDALIVYNKVNPPESIQQKYDFLMVMHTFKDLSLKVGTQSALDCYRQTILQHITDIQSLPTVHEKIQAYHALLKSLRGNDLPQIENLLHQALKNVMTTEWPDYPKMQSELNAVFDEFQKIGLLAQKIIFKDNISWKIAQKLHAHFGEMYPDPRLVDWIKNQTSTGKSLEGTFSELNERFLALKTKIDSLNLLDQAHQLLNDLDNAKLYYLFNFRDSEKYASNAYTYRLFERDLYHAERFQKDPQASRNLRKEFKFKTPMPSEADITAKTTKKISELEFAIKLLNSTLQQSKVAIPLKNITNRTLKMINTGNVEAVDFDAMLGDKKYSAFKTRINAVKKILSEVEPEIETKKQKLKIELVPTKTNLVQAFRITDRYNSCLLTRNKRHAVNRVSFALAEETGRFAYRIYDPKKKSTTEKKGLLHFSVGYTHKKNTDRQIPTLFVDSPLGDNLTENRIHFEKLMEQMEAYAKSIGCERVQLFLDTKHDKYECMTGYSKTEESTYKDDTYIMQTSLVSEATKRLYQVALSDSLSAEIISLNLTDTGLHYQFITPDQQVISGKISAEKLSQFSIPITLDTSNLSEHQQRILYIIEKQTKISVFEHESTAWVHGHLDWGEKINTTVFPDDSVQKESYSRDISEPSLLSAASYDAATDDAVEDTVEDSGFTP